MKRRGELDGGDSKKGGMSSEQGFGPWSEGKKLNGLKGQGGQTLQ